MGVVGSLWKRLAAREPRTGNRTGWTNAYVPRTTLFSGRLGRAIQEDAIEREVEFWTADPDEERTTDDA